MNTEIKVFTAKSTISGGTTMAVQASSDKTTALSVVGDKPKTTETTHKHATSTSTSYASQSYTGGTGSYGHASAPTMSPTKAFEYGGIEFWGSGVNKLDDVKFREGDMIINATYSEWKAPVTKPFIKSAPKWLNISETMFSGPKSYDPPQIMLDWQDFKPPPSHVTISFWKTLLVEAKKNDIKRIFMCCQAGQGRTGTALSSFVIANGMTKDADIAIAFVRHCYSDHAVETKDQEAYVASLTKKPVVKI